MDLNSLEKIENPYSAMFERLHLLDRSIQTFTLVNSDLRRVLHKQKPLPQFVRDSFKRPTVNKTKSVPILVVPVETEEMRLAASVIDKAKRVIENGSDKKPKPTPPVIPPSTSSAQGRSSSTVSGRPASASSTVRRSSVSATNPLLLQPSPSEQQPVRRYTPAHMKAPFLTQPEKKRRSHSSNRPVVQTSSNRGSNEHRSINQQQRRPSSSSVQQPVARYAQQTTRPSSVRPTESEENLTLEQQNSNANDNENIVPDRVSNTVITAEEPISIEMQQDIPGETLETNTPVNMQPPTLDRTLIKPLRRISKQNQNLRVRLKRELDKKATLSPPHFIKRVNEEIHSSNTTNSVHIPNVDVLILLAIKLRAIVLHLLETSTFDDLDCALKRLNTLKYLVSQYRPFFTHNITILVAKRPHRPMNININIEEWLKKPKRLSKQVSLRYTHSSQLLALAEVRFKQFESECRWIELSWCEQLIARFRQSLSNKNDDHTNLLPTYRELLSLVTDQQTSTPIIIENK